MSQDLWINAVRVERETSPAFEAARNTILAWQSRPMIDFFTPAPPDVVAAGEVLQQLGDMTDVAREAGRRYQRALDVYRLG